MSKLRRYFLSIAAIFALSGSLPAISDAAENPVYTGLFSAVAINGYDPVAYFAQGKPVKGTEKLSYEWMGAEWYFSTEDNLSAFKSMPEKFAPQYGGYCAWAVAHGDTASTDPYAWRIVGDKLYLNYSQDIQKRWEKDIPGYIQSGDHNWPKVLE
ncbi:YHS domain-containing (seleno)protein [Kiloniella laminariae]|uniref:YHS domain-containing (seleno)protein n=1 Tax=Kiloniella laminariae TaxID=454162 RepID=UPI000380F10B|nr:YHS domain-containing (seleno)protein [Kiloniella laminariae]